MRCALKLQDMTQKKVKIDARIARPELDAAGGGERGRAVGATH